MLLCVLLDSGRVFGMGSGLFVLVLFTVLFFVAWSVVGHSESPILYRFVMFIFITLLYIFFLLAPKRDSGEPTPETDDQFWYRFPVGFFLFFISVPCAVWKLLTEFVFYQRRHEKPVDALSRRQEELELYYAGVK